MSIEPITIPMSIEVNDVTIDSTIETNDVTIESTFDAKIEVVEGGDISVQSLTITENGTTTAPTGKAYSPVIVNVPNSYTNTDEGKVVQNGALTSQTSTTKSANGTYDTTTNNQVTVSVPASAVDTGTKSISTNGTHDVVGYASAAVSVPNTYTASDEGKVVSSGALVSQTSATFTSNGTYDTTTNDEVVVNVSGGTPTLITKTITANGTYDAEDDDADGYSEVTVNVSGGVKEAELNDVNFYDYDGTRLYSYSASDFLNSTEFPQNPNHDGLIFYAWNWTLADAKEYVAKYGILEIGATYKTSDGTTRFYFDIYNSFVLTIAIRCKPSVSKGVTIDWGDGTTSTVSGTSYTNVSHTYSSIGKYVAKVAVTNGTVSFGGGSGTYIIGPVGNNAKRKLSTVKRIEFGDNVILETHVFNSLPNLDAIVLPWNLTSLGNYSFDTMYPIKGIVFPSGFTSIGATNNPIFLLGVACLPKSLNNGNVIITGQTVRAISMPEGCFVRSTNASIGIQKIIIPDGVTTITANAYRYAHNARYIEIGKDVTSIEATSFMEAPASEIHLKPTTPPNLANTNVFANWLQDIAVFYVPYSEDHSVLEAYKTATNWSTWSTRFQEEPQ